IYTMADRVAGPMVGIGAAVLGVITMTSMANSGLLAASRFPFAMSRNKLMPDALSYVSARFMTPVPAIVLTGSLMAAAIIFLDVEGIAKLASSLMIAGYMANNLAVLVLRESSIQWYKPTFRSPLYPYVQVVGVVLGLALMFTLGLASMIALAAMTIPGLLLFLVFGRRQTDRLGVLGRLGPRRELLTSPQPHLELPTKAAVVVPLLGKARGAESLAELGDALGGGDKVEVVHITDVPEQIALDADLQDPLVGSLRRRIQKLAEERRHDIVFDAVATHDHIRIVHEISRRVHCEWLVMEWQGRTERGVLPFNPLGWLVDHLSCNLAVFKDVGSRYVTTILAVPEPGPHDALVAITADHLAKVHRAELTFARWVDEQASGDEVRAEQGYLDQMVDLCTTPPKTRLVRGRDAVNDLAGLTADFDLLVLGAPPEIRWWRQVRGSRSDRLMRQSACSALRLKAPRMLIDRAFSLDTAADSDRVPIDRYLVGECMAARLPRMTKQQLFGYFAHAFDKAIEGVDAQAIEDALWDRERAQSTAIGKGLAVPHATVANASRSYVGVFTTAEAMDYRAPDGAPVDVFFVTMGPPSDRNTHLKILSSLAWLVTETRLLERLRASDNASELQAVLLASSTLHVKPVSDTPPELARPPGSLPPPAELDDAGADAIDSED
ncbi:MAG: amino acid permease, partial [Myxococcales bacterium]|nr:amino acid permease [Myxococcales bacterium]